MFASHRKKVGAVLTAIGALVLTACAAPAPAPETTTAAPEVSGKLTVWTEDYYVAIFEPLAQEWAAEVGIEIEFVTKEFSEMTNQFIAAVPAGEGPDIFIAGMNTSLLVGNGVVAPVELGDKAGLFSPNALAAGQLDGVQYGIPFSIENVAVYRNTDLAPEPAATFDDAIAAGNALVDAGSADSPFAVGVGPDGNPYLLMGLQSSFGSTLFNGEELTIDDEAGQAFASALAGWGASGAINPDMGLDIALNQFKEGRTPYLITGPWDLNGIKESGVPYVIDPIPSAGGQVAAPFAGNFAAYQSAESQNPLAASLFMTDFMTRTKTAVGIFEGNKTLPALIPAQEEVSSDPDVAAFAAIGASAVSIPGISAMNQVWGPWGETQMAILRGQAADPVKAWIDMGVKIREAIAAAG
ncbi:MAG: extracellular solute-binding protein [Fimbriimonas sp.]|nr:extracellular solute-binding protein [Fimbriimonas sp.]